MTSLLTIEQRSTLGWLYEISVKSGFLEQTFSKAPDASKRLGQQDSRWGLSWKDILSSHREWIDRYFRSESEKRSFQQHLNYLWPLGYAQGVQMSIDLFSYPYAKPIPITELVRIFCPFPDFPMRDSTSEDRDRIAQELQQNLGVVATRHDRGHLVHADLAIEIRNGGAKRPPVRIVVDLSFYVAALESQGRGLTDLEGYWRSPFRMDPLYVPVAHQAYRNMEKSAFSVHLFGSLRQQIEEQLLDFYDLFSGREKSFFKTCQAASYLDDWCRLSEPEEGTRLIAGACTPFGLEVLESLFENHRMGDPLNGLRDFYRKRQKITDEDMEGDAWISRQRSALQEVLRRLYRVLGLPQDSSSRAILWLEKTVDPFGTEDFLDISTSETFWGRATEGNPESGERWHPDAFCNPASPLDHPLIAKALEGYTWCRPNGDRKTFRDLHADALRYGFFRMSRPKPKASSQNFSLTFALAHPGAGKTTTVIRTLTEESVPCLFWYASPRVSINDSVVGQIQEKLGNRPGIAITTNSAVQGKAADFGHQGVVTYENWSGPIKPYNGVGYVPVSEMEEARTRFSHGASGRTSLHLHKDTESRRSLRTGDTGVSPVLKTLFDGVLGLLRNKEDLSDMRFFLASVALQAFRSRSADDLGVRIGEFLKDSAKAILTRCDTESGERPRIVWMLDEVTGSSEGLSIVRTVVSQMRQSATMYPGVDFHLVVADASLVNENILKQWLLSSDGDFPACVLWDSGGLEVPVFRRIDWGGSATNGDGAGEAHGESPTTAELLDDRLSPWFGGATVVEASAYPAGRLRIHPLLRIWQEHAGDGKRLNPRSARMATILSVTQKAYESCPSGEQVLVFVQDKHLLEELQAALCHSLGLSMESVRILSADVGPNDRRSLMKDGGERIRIVLMTSAGSRGIDFPKVSRYVINVNHFAPESTLLEVQQVLFRGRGGGCDSLDREVWFTLSDVLPYDPEMVGTEDGERRFLRFLFDRLSMLVLLRATLLTRASGRSWMPRKNDQRQDTDSVLCPLGETGQSEREMPIVSLFQNALRSVDVLTQKGVLAFEDKKNFYERFLKLFTQDVGKVYFDHKNAQESVWMDHPILGLLDPEWFSVYWENAQVNAKAQKAREQTEQAFLLDKPLVVAGRPRALLRNPPREEKSGCVWIRGFLCVLEIDRARLKIQVPPKLVEERKKFGGLVGSFLKTVRNSRGERVGDHEKPLSEFANLLDRDDVEDVFGYQEDYGRDPGKILVVTPLFPPHVQSDPDARQAYAEDLRWVSTLMSASAILDDRDKRRWPMLLPDYDVILRHSQMAPTEKPFLLVFSSNTGRPFRMLQRLQTTRGFNLLVAALPND